MKKWKLELRENKTAIIVIEDIDLLDECDIEAIVDEYVSDKHISLGPPYADDDDGMTMVDLTHHPEIGIRKGNRESCEKLMSKIKEMAAQSVLNATRQGVVNEN